MSSDGLILRGLRIVLPQSLRSSAVKLAHEGHQGICKTKSLLRAKIWFPGIDAMVEEEVRLCRECQINGEKVRPEPLRMTQMPDNPWEYLRADFKGPLPDGNMAFVVQDEHSRFPTVSITKSTAFEDVAPALEDLFSLYGIPIEIKTDNGSPF